MNIWPLNHKIVLIALIALLSVSCTVKKPEDVAEIPEEIVVPDPTLLTISPLVVSNNNSPVVTGSSVPMITIKIYSDASCSTLVGTGLTRSDGNFTITLTVPDNVTISIFATASVPGKVSNCVTSSLTYSEDSSAPAIPAFASSSPVSPSSNNSPVITGTAEAQSTVKIYSDALCSSQLQELTADGAGAFSYSPVLAENSTHNFYATATDRAGNASACSSSAFTYIEDSIAAAPVFLSSTPISPSNNNNPVLAGTAEAGSTLNIYSDNACSSFVATSSVSSAGDFSYNASVADNSTSNFYGRITDLAGNISLCSSSAFSYVEDSIAPNTPSVTSTTPAMPSDSNTPNINGSAEAGSQIHIYSDAACTTLEGTGTVGAFGTYSAQVTALDNLSKTFYAKATDSAGNSSACSSSSQSYSAYTIPEGMAWLQGTTTSATATNTNLNQTTAFSLRWTTASFFHSTFYSHSTVANPHQLSIKVPGDYLASVHIPIRGTAAGASIRAEVRVNGIAVDHGRIENAYISNASGHQESSLSAKVFLKNLVSDDKIEVSVIRAGTAATVTAPTGASLNVERIEPSKNIFFAKATQTVASTDLNGASASGLSWVSEAQSSAFGHSNSASPQQISLSAGTYLLAVNVPYTSLVANTNVQLQVKKNGALISGAKASHGLIKATNGHNNSSAHWYGVLTDIQSSDIITVETIQEAAAGVVTVPPSKTASIYIESIPSSQIYVGGGSSLVTNSNWNNSTTAQLVRWTIDNLIDASIFTHSTSAIPQRVTLANAGTYQIYYRNSLSGTATNSNASNRLKLNNALVSGAEAKSNFISNVGGQTESSSVLNFLLRDVAAGGYIEVDSFREAASGTVSSNGNAQLVIIQKPLALTP